MSQALFRRHRPRALRGARRATIPYAYPPLRSGARRHGQDDGRAAAARGLLLAQLRLDGLRHVRRADLRAAVGRRDDEGRARQGRRRLRDVHDPRLSLLHLPRQRRRAGGREPRRVRPQPRRDDRRLRREDAGDRRQAAVGHRQSLQPSALHGGRGDQSRPGRVRLRRRAGEERASTRRTSSAARTTCCGAGARATRRCSTPTSSASWSSSAASCRWSSSTSTRSASRA